MTPQQAQAELARRELARRELSRRGGASEQVAQQSGKFGAMTKAPTAIELIGTNLTAPETKPLGVSGGLGVALSAAGIPEENILPAVGQGVGGMASGFPGAGWVGATGGAVAGQGLKQILKKLRGQEPEFGEMGKEALVTGAIEGATRGTGNFIFRRQVANEALGTLSKKLSEMKKVMSANPELNAPVHDVYSTMREAFDSLPEPMQKGSIANKLKDWLKFMSNKSEVSAKDLILMESDLGQAAKYGQMEKGAFVPATEIPNPAGNTIAKEGRRGVSDIVDELAQQSGQKDWKSISSKISRLLKNPDKTDVTKATGNVFSRLATAGAVGGLTQNPLAFLGTYAGMKLAQSPEVRNTAFRALRSPVGMAVDTGTKLSLAEMARKR